MKLSRIHSARDASWYGRPCFHEQPACNSQVNQTKVNTCTLTRTTHTTHDSQHTRTSTTIAKNGIVNGRARTNQNDAHLGQQRSNTMRHARQVSAGQRGKQMVLNLQRDVARHVTGSGAADVPRGQSSLRWVSMVAGFEHPLHCTPLV